MATTAAQKPSGDLSVIPPIFKNLFSLQVEILYNFILTLLSPIIALFSLFSQSFDQAQKVTRTVDSAVHASPTAVARGGSLLVRKMVFGCLGAIYACMVMVMVMVVAVVLGVWLVGMWVEEPVFVREKLLFDYTDVNPNAVFEFGGGGVGGFWGKKGFEGVPVGHTFYVCLDLLMPDSDYNREIGMFQVVAELVSANGKLIERTSHPCMMRFRSLPIRLMQTFFMSIPLLLGITAETQKLRLQILKHKEAYPRTKAIKISLISRARTFSPPQVYEAELLLHSELPWRKNLVRSWKWTFYVWASFYIYISLLILLICCFRPIMLPILTTSFDSVPLGADTAEDMREEPKVSEDRQVSETLRRWKERRSKRRRTLKQGISETTGSSASSISISRDDRSVTTEDVGDSESVCF